MRVKEIKASRGKGTMGSLRAQVWSIDVIIGVTLFLSAIILFYVYAVNFSDEAQERTREMENDGRFVSSNLLSEGSPRGWNLSNVEVPGLAKKNRINQTKLDFLYLLNSQDYNKTKRLLNTRFDFYFFFTQPLTTNNTVRDGIGKPGLNRTTILSQENPKNIVKTSRYIIYQNEPTVMNLYLWEK